jgi:hypothetical protein
MSTHGLRTLGRAALLLLAAGCSRPERAPPPTASATRSPSAPSASPLSAADRGPADEFFARWLRAHGEPDVVTDARGVGVAGNETRLRATLYGVTEHGSSLRVVETEFRVHLPSGGEIVEYVAGMGASQEEAEDDARANFVQTTFHVVYRSFINASDPHQAEEPIVIHGAKRWLVRGAMIARTYGDAGAIDVSSIEPQVVRLVAALPLSGGPHWIKLVYSQTTGVPDTVEVSLDNEVHEGLTAAVRALSWPRTPALYTIKQFMVVK